MKPLSEWDKWITNNILAPLENNYGKYLKGGQMRFFCAELAQWSEGDLKETLRFILAECEFFPRMADFHRLRPKPREPDYLGTPATMATIPVQPGSWGDFVGRTCSRYLKTKNLVGMYEALIVEMERRKMPEDELHHGLNVGINGMREALRDARARKARREVVKHVS